LYFKRPASFLFMPAYISVPLLLLGLALPLMESNAQVYTYTPSVDCSGTWQDGNCWTKTLLDEPANCNPNGDWPPFAPTGCQVQVIINHDLAISEDVELGGTFASLQLGAEAVLTIDGNLTIEGKKDIQFILEGSSRINVTQALTISQGGLVPQQFLIWEVTGRAC